MEHCGLLSVHTSRARPLMLRQGGQVWKRPRSVTFAASANIVGVCKSCAGDHRVHFHKTYSSEFLLQGSMGKAVRCGVIIWWQYVNSGSQRDPRSGS